MTIALQDSSTSVLAEAAATPTANRKRRKPERLESAPAQVQLAFHTALYETPENTGYTLDFWEAIPKFRLAKRRYTEKPELWESSFRWEDETIPVKIIPALIQRNQNSKELHAVIPGPREEIIWRVLVELAAEQAVTNTVSQGSVNQRPFAPVRFTLNGLRERLDSRAKAHTIAEIKEALLVLKRAECVLSHPLGAELEDYSNYLVHLHFRGDKLDDGSVADSCIAHLNPLATTAILKMRCWPIDNAKVLRLNSSLARWLITRICNRYRQADKANVITGESFHLLLSTIRMESGIIPEKRLRDDIGRVREALRELKEAKYFNEWKPFTEELIYAPKTSTGPRAICDAKWTFFPSGELIDYIIEGNKTMDKKRKKLSEAHPTTLLTAASATRGR